MRVRFTKQVGDIRFEIEEEAKDEKNLFDVVEFWSSIPTSHPSGATDLQFAHREAQGFHYYEITCKSADERFCFGQRKEGGGLFPKGWEKIYHGDDELPSQQSRPVTQARPAASGNGESIDRQIRAQFQRLNIINPGAEKQAVMRALNTRVGNLVAELGETEKADVLDWLQHQEVGRAA